MTNFLGVDVRGAPGQETCLGDQLGKLGVHDFFVVGLEFLAFVESAVSFLDG